MRRARCWTPPAPGITPNACSGWLKIADSRAAKRMSHASTNSLPAPRTRPSICAMVTSRLALRWRNRSADRRLAGQLRRLLPVLLDPGHVDVGDEIVGVGALEHEHLNGVVGLGTLNEGHQIADQLGPEQIHRRSRDLHEQNGSFPLDAERLVNRELWALYRHGRAFGYHFTNVMSGLPFSTTYVASSAPLPLPTFLAVWIVPAVTNRTSPALTVTGGLPPTSYSSVPSRT